MIKNEMTVLKQNLLGGMNSYIIEKGDEDIYESWTRLVPDECDEDDLEFIANDEELWCDVCRLFGILIKRMGE